MNRFLLAAFAATSFAFAQQPPMPDQSPAEDPRQWLEDVTGERALGWVRERNAESTKVLADNDAFRATRDRILSILDSTARIPYVAKRGEHFYNFWQDAKNPRGLWRRTTLAEYQKDEPQWDVVLDLDALGKQEGENWVWHGAAFLRPDCKRVLLSLSRGGADASRRCRRRPSSPRARSRTSPCRPRAIRPRASNATSCIAA